MTTETNTSDVEKILKSRRKQNFEDVANNMQLDKEDTRRSNWNSKYQEKIRGPLIFSCKYLSLTLVLKCPVSFVCFIAGFQCHAIESK